MQSQVKHAIGIFLKFPIPGEVKTRLGEKIGFQKACDFYKKAVEFLLFSQKINWQILEKRNIRKHIFIHPGIDHSLYDKWLGLKANTTLLQAEGDLGKKLYTAFKDLFTRGFQKCIIIGSDCLLLDTSRIINAFKKLEKTQCVLGPCADGGYYLIGQNNNIFVEIFQEIPWSTVEVLFSTTQVLNRNQIKFELLEELFDVDTLDDLDRLQSMPEFSWVKNFIP
ncbi:TIGR04282 family arsenosugar biosynthesis glycosyltransferase [Candidatus Riflebacteria bacterium]